MISKYYRDKKVLVTGGAGLIGSCITDELIECGADVVVLDNLYRGKKSYIKQVAKTNFLQCDILDTASYREPLMEAQIVVHAASKVLGIGYSSKNHLDMMLHNDNMTNALFETLINSKKLEHLVVVSSSCVYDDNGPDMVSGLTT